jgi:hypothetical protein
VITLSQRMAQACASERERAITNACSLADRPGLVPAFVCSDLSVGEVLHRLLQLRELDRIQTDGVGAVLPN